MIIDGRKDGVGLDLESNPGLDERRPSIQRTLGSLMQDLQKASEESAWRLRSRGQVHRLLFIQYTEKLPELGGLTPTGAADVGDKLLREAHGASVK